MKIPLVAISAFVVVVVLAAVLMPVLGDAQKTEDTFTNDGYFHMTKYTAADEDLTLTWDYTDPGVVTVNGNDFDLSTVGIPITVLASTNGGARFEYVGTNQYCQFCNSAGILTAAVSASATLTIVCSSGTMTATYSTPDNPDVTRTSTYDEYYCISETGDYVMKKTTSPAYMLNDSPIFALGVTKIGSPAITLSLQGSIDDGITVTQVSSTPTITYSTPVLDYSSVSDHNDLNKLTKITFTGDNGGTVVNITYSYFIVPAEVTAERSVHLNGNEIAILGAIPALVIVALLIGVLALYMRSRAE